jgi:DNA processing protein
MRALLDRFGDADAVFGAPPRELTRTAGIDRNLALAVAAFPRGAAGAEAARFADDQIAKLGQAGGRCLSVRDAEYPSSLKRIYDPPPLLFVKGSLLPADSCSLAVVGTRRPSAYGVELAERFAEGLGRLGITVVSGLARGIDTAAHGVCVRCGLRTLAVIGSGIDVPYPPENRALEARIASLGAVVSEYPMGTRPDAGNFPRRNRIISGIALGTIVIETALDGGAMITARAALDQNREVFAVPSPVRSGPPSGTNRLIREGRALLVESVEDVIKELRPGLAGVLPPGGRLRLPERPPLTLFEQRVLDALPGGEAPLHIDALAARAGMPVSEILAHLLALECKGAVRQLPGKYFMATLAGIAAASLAAVAACFS